MSRSEDLSSPTLDDDTEAHLFNKKDEAAEAPAQGDGPNNRMAPSLVSLPWARHWAVADTVQ